MGRKKKEESVEKQDTFNEDDMSILYDDEGNVIEEEDLTDLDGEEILEEDIEEE